MSADIIWYTEKPICIILFGVFNTIKKTWQDKINPIIKNITALIIGLVFAVSISEISLQILDFPSHPVSGWLNCKDKNPGECNQMGFRGREITYTDDEVIVVLLGDSEVYAPRIPFEQRPENRLEHHLKKYKDKIRVFSIADLGYGQDQQYLALKEYYKDYRADLVLLMFTARNDIEDNIFPTSGFNNTVKPTFWLENGTFLGPTEEWMETIGPRSKLALLWSIHIGKSFGEERLRKWRNEIVPPFYQGLEHYEGEVDYSWQELWGNNRDEYKSYEYERVGNGGNELTPRSELRMYGIDLTRRLLSRIHKLVETNHGHFIIFKEERPWEVQDQEKVYFLNGKYYKLSTKQARETLNDIFHGFEHHAFPLNLEDYTVNPKDEHLNKEAIDKLMENLSLVISKKGYFKE